MYKRQQYLLGRQIKVRTDHAALTWLRKTPEPIGQQARWLEIMEEFDFTVEHRPGARHSNADAMSRRPCPKKDCFCSQQVSAYSGDGPGKLSAMPSAMCSREVKSTSCAKESLREKSPAPVFNGPADQPPARPTSTEVKSKVSSHGDGALLSRSTKTGRRCQDGDGPGDRPPTPRLNGPADRPRIGRRRRKYRRSQVPNLETIMEGDEVLYREVCNDVKLFNFGESRSPCRGIEEDEDLIDFDDGTVSCRVVNEGRDLMDFSDVQVSDHETLQEVVEDNELNELSQDETKSAGLNPLAEEYQPSHHPVLMGGGRC